jgi:hypothetical protein
MVNIMFTYKLQQQYFHFNAYQKKQLFVIIFIVLVIIIPKYLAPITNLSNLFEKKESILAANG